MNEEQLAKTDREKGENQAGKTRIVRGKPADRQFDIDFWQEQGDEAIFAAVWKMICIAEEVKHGAKPTFSPYYYKDQALRALNKSGSRFAWTKGKYPF